MSGYFARLAAQVAPRTAPAVRPAVVAPLEQFAEVAPLGAAPTAAVAPAGNRSDMQSFGPSQSAVAQTPVGEAIGEAIGAASRLPLQSAFAPRAGVARTASLAAPGDSAATPESLELVNAASAANAANARGAAGATNAANAASAASAASARAAPEPNLPLHDKSSARLARSAVPTRLADAVRTELFQAGAVERDAWDTRPAFGNPGPAPHDASLSPVAQQAAPLRGHDRLAAAPAPAPSAWLSAMNRMPVSPGPAEAGAKPARAETRAEVRIGSITLEVRTPPPAPAPRPVLQQVAAPAPAATRFSLQRHYLRWS